MVLGFKSLMGFRAFRGSRSIRAFNPQSGFWEVLASGLYFFRLRVFGGSGMLRNVKVSKATVSFVYKWVQLTTSASVVGHSPTRMTLSEFPSFENSKTQKPPKTPPKLPPKYLNYPDPNLKP